MIQSLVDGLILSWGWRRWGAAFVLGCLAALCQAPFDLFFVLWLSFPGLVWLIDSTVAKNEGGKSRALRAAAAVGWWFGFGYFLAGLWWIGSAFLVEADDFAWMMPFAVLAMPAGLALFWAGAAVVARLLWIEGPLRILVLAATLSGAEWLRGHVLTGFPWNAIGYGFAANTLMMQPAALVGIYGLGFLSVLVFAAPAVLADAERLLHRFAFLGAVALLFAASLGYGAYRLNEPAPADVANVRLRIVQPDIPQVEKWAPGNVQWIFERYLDLSSQPLGPNEDRLDKITHVIWPESAFPFILTQEPGALASIEALLPENTVLITGAVRAEPAANGGTPGREADFYNSIYVINGDGTIVDAYDKVHLVPFGEYLPLRGLLTRLGLENMVRVPGGFTPGFRHRELTPPGAPELSPLICYEAIFPGAVADRGDRPGSLLNLTNDAWFGDAPGPHQHLRQARLRAVEEGLPMVRDANTGISAVIDARGRIRAQLPLGRSGAFDANLPGADLPTVYVEVGDWPLAIALLLVFSAAGYARLRASTPQFNYLM
ncbi:apolipoprotein N-acyltransferase [Breoghania sp.]|uniref:apolipoprotein N-acyltransferase n=1 Tax=Breoghania sp. TaxID=2065378 RepID=UPI002604D0BE|nr:apolipoprotein N-acyltransferase [Breoghania sp.]MDJ0930873.1 apolipoprotein N-acyltransferase [Breoghania sp.]